LIRRYKTARCILHRQGRYLLAAHNTRSVWGLPGGHIEWRESPEEAARREVHEELDIYIGSLLHVGDYQYKRSLHAVYGGAFEGEIGDLSMSELVDARWFEWEEIAELATSGGLHAGYEQIAVGQLRAKLGLVE
jgi:8-oxo-dGTP diphosphatase